MKQPDIFCRSFCILKSLSASNPKHTALLRYYDVLNENKSVTFEILSETLDNRWIEISAYPAEIGLTCYFRDISSRKIAEETLRQSEEKFSKAFQLILNLCRNGLDAMDNGGCLTIKTHHTTDEVVLTIEDEGCGIPTEHIEKLGTPFFTTKNQGTGLGLAICYRIALSNNAKIDVSSNPKGTVFSIRFAIPCGLTQERDKVI